MAGRVFDALARGGVEAMLPFVHKQFVMVTPPELASEPGTYNGHDGIRRWFDSFYEAMEEVRLEPDRVETAGEQVAVSFQIVARGRSTGLEMVQQAVALFRAGGRAPGRMRFFVTWDEAVEAAGSPPESSPHRRGGPPKRAPLSCACGLPPTS